jgi:hypothetical protein
MSKKEKPDIGFVYLLSNPALQGMVKIGFSLQAADIRARELSKSTAIPLDFEVEDEWWVEAPAQYERLIHAKLVAERVTPSKEFFFMSVSDATDLINNVIYGGKLGVLDANEVWRHFLSMLRKYPEHADMFKEVNDTREWDRLINEAEEDPSVLKPLLEKAKARKNR